MRVLGAVLALCLTVPAGAESPSQGTTGRVDGWVIYRADGTAVTSSTRPLVGFGEVRATVAGRKEVLKAAAVDLERSKKQWFTADCWATLDKAAMQGRPFPKLHGSSTTGVALTLEPSSTKWTYVHVWAAFCEPCRHQLASLRRWMDSHPDAPLRVVSIHHSSSEADWRKALKDLRTPDAPQWTNAIVDDEQAYEVVVRLNMAGRSNESFLLDPEGCVVRSAMTPPTLIPTIEQTLDAKLRCE